jgi:hypothetical protein
LVTIPESSEKGKIVKAKTGYVYLQLGYTWDPVKRQPRYKRITIGKQASQHPGKMYFSKEYETYFGVVDEEVADLRKKYGNRELRLASKLNLSISFGPFAAIEAACEKAGWVHSQKAGNCAICTSDFSCCNHYISQCFLHHQKGIRKYL